MKKHIKKHRATFPITARDVYIIYRQESPGAQALDMELCDTCAERANDIYYSMLEERFIFGSPAWDDAIRERWGRVGLKLFRKWEERAAEAACDAMDEREAAME